MFITAENRGHIADLLVNHQVPVAVLNACQSGKQAGDKLNVTIEAGEAYGERNEELIQDVPLEAFQGVDQVAAGMQFQANGPHGPQLVTVTKVEGETVTIDGNHPLAGEQLTFDVEVMEVREATEEELEHGHVHGPGGHEHD